MNSASGAKPRRLNASLAESSDMATPESKVKRKVHEWLAINMPDHWRVSPRGGPFGKQGCPDDIICWHGFFIAIEEKAMDGTATDMQLAQLKLIIRAGGVAAIVRGYDVARLNRIRDLILKKVAILKAAEQCPSP